MGVKPITPYSVFPNAVPVKMDYNTLKKVSIPVSHPSLIVRRVSFTCPHHLPLRDLFCRTVCKTNEGSGYLNI